MEKVPIPAKAGRLINAVASIGYDPEVALCDLMDNSIDANASEMQIYLQEETRDEEGEVDTVGRYVIADNGKGMDAEALINAFTLGSQRAYPSGSLGKFGIGLKSAGLSLGRTIALISRQEGQDLICAVLSVTDIEESGEYRVSLGAPTQAYQGLWDAYAPDKNRGTVLVIEDLTENQPAFASFTRYIKRYCGITYHLLLEDTSKPLKISINGDAVPSIDPLFMGEAVQNGSLNPQDWNGTTVHLLLADHKLLLDDNTQCTIAATHLIHPPSFESEGDGVRNSKRDYYQIETDPYTARPRHGFYVYRNRRVIVMAERFHGLISNQTQAWAFRGRLMFDESADSALALDVKKRHMRLPKGARNNLKNLISNHQRKSIDAWKRAGEKESERKKERKDELANDSVAKTHVPDLGYAPGADLSTEDALTARKELQSRVEAETLASIQDKDITKKELNKRAEAHDVVVPIAGMKANAMWLPYPAVELNRAETLINKSHTWIAEAFAAAEDDPRIAIVLYQLFTILARAELEVRSTAWGDLPDGTADKVLERFRRKASAIGEDLADALASEIKNARSSYANEAEA